MCVQYSTVQYLYVIFLFYVREYLEPPAVLTTVALRAPLGTGEVVILVPSLKLLESYIKPVIVPSLFCFQFFIVGGVACLPTAPKNAKGEIVFGGSGVVATLLVPLVVVVVGFENVVVVRAGLPARCRASASLLCVASSLFCSRSSLLISLSSSISAFLFAALSTPSLALAIWAAMTSF